MEKKGIVCHCMDVSKRDIKIAMTKGARTLENIQELTGAGTVCGGCIELIEKILSTACKCVGATMKEVIDAVNNGADTLEKIEEVTKAGSVAKCGKCKPILQSVIDLKR